MAFSPDGRLLATSNVDSAVRVYDVTTGKEVKKLEGHQSRVFALAFAPDGSRLASGGGDTTALLWDVAALHRRSRREVKLGHAETERLWDELAGQDAARAYRAVCRLACDPAAASLLKERLRPTSPCDGERLAKALRDLGSERFAVRERASAALEQLGEAAEPALRRALAKELTLEVHRRVERALAELQRWSPERLRRWRALEVLERVGTPAAREVLRTLAGGVSGAWLTQGASAALGRLEQRVGSP